LTRVRLATVVLGVGLALIATQSVRSASAATYDVHACRLPNGTAAPALGWAATGPSTPGAVLSINCPGGAMTGRPADGTHAAGTLHGFYFDAPAGTTIAGFDSASEGVVTTTLGGPPPWNWNYGTWGTVADTGRFADIAISCGNCGPFNAAWDNPLPVGLSRIIFGLECDKYRLGACPANGSHFTLRRVALHVEDLKPPQVLAGSGTLLDTTAPLRGERNLTLQLRDVGGGLLKTRIDVDGQRLMEQPIADLRGTCKPPFVAPVPCNTAATVDLPIDTTRLSDGAHELSVRVFDATGVNSAVYGPIRVVIDNVADPVPPGRLSCPRNAAMAVTRRLEHRVVRFGALTWLTGRVTGPSSALRGATVALVDSSGVRMPVPVARIRRHGRFKLRLRPVRQGQFRPVLLSTAAQPQACGRKVSLKVRAGLRFSVVPERLRNGQTMTMTGQLRALPVPATGKAVAIQARAKGAPSWTTVSLVRSDPRGRFKYRYRFRRTFERTTYEFRAVAPKERSYPYLAGSSPTRRAIVMP